MKKVISLAAVALFLSGSMAWAQTANEFSVKQAADYGLKNAVQVKNALLDVLIQQQTNRDITSAAFPQLSGNGSFTDYLDIPTSLLPGEFFGGAAGTFIPVKFGTKYTASGGFSLNQILFDGQVFVGLQARQTSIDARQKAAEVTQENIKANIYKIYYQLVVSKTQIELLDANITRLQKLDHDTREIYKNGFAEKVDVDKLTVQIANLQTEKLKALNSIANGYTGLKVLMGMPVKDSLVLTDTLSEAQVKENVLEGSSYQYADRKDYQLLDLSNKLNAYNIKRYKLSQIPTLSFNANYVKQAQRSQFNFFKKSGDWFTTSYIGLSLNIPIFKGFSTRAKIQGAKLALQQTQNQLDGLKITIDNDVEVAKNNFTTATATMDYQKKNMALAELVYEQTKKKYEIGTGSATEINTAQVDLKTAQTNYISALYDAIIARVDLLKATGKL
jgi:outer membrane protein